MFGRSKPVVFNPYGSRRARRGLPRWLVLLVVGTAIGAGAVLLIQDRYLPPRLSAQESAKLRTSFEQAEAERQRLEGELADATKRLDAALAEKKSLTGELGASRQTAARLREDVVSLVASLPPDPRNGPVSVRAARFALEGGSLAYDVVLSRERPGSSPLGGVLQFVVAGASGRGPENSVTLKPVPISVGSYDSVRGTLPLPEGFRPRQTTIQVLDRVGGKLLGMRVIPVK